MKHSWGLVVGLVLVMPCLVWGSDGSVHLDKVRVDLTDKPSLQRGAKIFFNYCAGCHSLQYARYGDLAKGIGVVDEKGELLDKVVKESFIAGNGTLQSPIVPAMDSTTAKKWFGKQPPDLSLVIRSRGGDWVYTFLRSFYTDKGKTWETNNLVFPDVGMPNILLNLQGEQVPVYRTETVTPIAGDTESKQVVASIALVSKGSMSPEQFDAAMVDLVNFLSYVAEPHRLEQHALGVKIMLYLLVLLVLAYLLKKEFWKDVH